MTATVMLDPEVAQPWQERQPRKGRTDSRNPKSVAERGRSKKSETALSTYIEDVDKTPLLNAQEERELAFRICEGDREARDHLVRANLRLVISLARRFAGRGLDLQDLIAEGNLGLLRAVEGFDPSVGTRFSTYAAYWIKETMDRALTNLAKPVRIPAYMQDLLTRWHRASTVLRDQLDRTPSDEEIALYLNLPKKKLKIVRKAVRIYNMSPHGANETGDQPMANWLIDDRSQSPDAPCLQADDLRQVMSLMDQIDPREAKVLQLRFGLGNEEPLTLQQIGDRLGMTRERIRQIETLALRKLRESLEEVE